MDIGTATPTAAEQGGIVHHGLDLVAPDAPYSVAEFKKYADETIRDIRSRGNIPIMVGGSGLYIDVVIYDYGLESAGQDSELRAELEELPTEDLQVRLVGMGVGLPENSLNRRYLIRAIEKAATRNGSGAAGIDYSAPDRQRGLVPDTIVLGLRVDSDVLEERIRTRVERMVDAGLVDEVRGLAEQYGWEIQAMQSDAYQAFRGYVDNTLSMDEAVALCARLDMKLAKRQRTWFKRNPSVQWLDNRDNLAEAVEIITTQMNLSNK
jgi:tRNA dimethylallyltransferase